MNYSKSRPANSSSIAVLAGILAKRLAIAITMCRVFGTIVIITDFVITVVSPIFCTVCMIQHY